MTREALIKHWDVIQAFKEGKEIEYYSNIKEKWCLVTDPIFTDGDEYRVKPEAKKRLPTIEEVEQWFLDNKVFKLTIQTHGLYRIEMISLEDESLRIGERSIKTEEFCKDFTNYDGSSLYITE